MNYGRLVQKLTSEFDLSSEIQKKQAFNKCKEYAQENFSDNKDFNAFFEVVSKSLKIPPLIKDTTKEKVIETGHEKIHLSYSKNSGPVLSGNYDGLIYLSKVLKELAESRENGNHVHFYYGGFPMYGNSYPLTIYFEDNGWFEKYAAKGDERESIDQRKVDINSLVGVLIHDEIPPSFYLTKQKIYKIIAVEKYNDQSVMVKKIRESNERVYIFTLLNDLGKNTQIGLDIDDQTILFFNEDALKNIS